MHCLYKLGQRHGSASIFVKYSECPFNKKFLKKTQFFIDCAMKERQSYIFRWHNFLELVQSELLLALPHVLPEHLLQPGDVLLVENSSLPASGEDEKTLQCES